MFGHYVATALRNCRRRPLSTAVKLLALALGFACFLTANLIADYVSRTDRQWANDGRIYAISQAVTAPGDEKEGGATIGAISGPAVEYLKVDFPDVVIAATNTIPSPVRADDMYRDYNVLAVDPHFVRIFDLEMVRGPPDALAAPRTALLEAAAARELFATEDVIGRNVQFFGMDMTVSGVFRWPSPSHLGAGGLGKNIRVIATRESLGIAGAAPPLWAGTCCTTYMLLPEAGPSHAAVQERLAQFSAARVPPEFGTIRFTLMELGDIGRSYLNLGLFGGSLDLSLVTILNAFAALILAVACLDFANLAIAEATTRSREFGVRKTVGARRRQVAAQAFVEAGLLTLAALALVLPLALLAVTPLGRALRLEIGAADLLAHGDYWLMVLGVAALVCLAAGAYPALVLARVRPVSTLRATGARGGTGAIRTALIVAQFAAASFLLAAVAVMVAQKAELRGRLADPSQDPRLTITVTNTSGPFDLATLLTELRSHPAITGVTSTAAQPFRRAVVTGLPPSTMAKDEDPNSTRIPIQSRFVGYGYFDVAGIRVLAGRDFDAVQDDRGNVADIAFSESGEATRNPAAPPQKIVIDEKTAARVGLTPQQAVGTLLYLPTQMMVASGPNQPPRAASILLPGEIVGVVAATPLEYMVEGPDNYVYRLQPRAASTLILRVARADTAAALAHVDAVWAKFFPGRPPQRVFLDEAFDTNFRMFDVLATTFIGLSVIAIAIAALGLFGIASFVVQRRTREIGVRKVLGATRERVLGLVVWDFSKLVIVANVIAWPLAWAASRSYLNLFVQRIDLSAAPFLLALAISMAIAWVAVLVHALRAARVKPALVLNTE